ncbi:MAG: hypothetical protein A2329_06330 [Sulfurimonas sp. RIFOXYB2_FULL_37_5]|uniref:hypothetical protein n=1 Tax=Sulfurimonas sp. RIFOXYB12_FULL_35_9 TaxID=1802256 RepID=UPI0008C5F431|nr:hypothetical protein [Sulfurimonas sp. RIFOXYB12_FULL_35_9]OHE04258.1 MAG: hypothetical protein A2345_09470 [Sulfurimonas sp. RIFOXYB12_FULL_35_9]OHE12505.1 MAG: hypothetical protein A2329_06330 [Sulfurimonas sp. RIFOXYB2_FULL_37_5]
MAYIAGIVVVALFFLALHYFTELTNRQKAVITVIVLSVVLSAIAFNSYSNAKSQKMLDVVMKFNQHGTVVCNGVSVNDENYTLSIGTYTFIGKKETPFYGQMISASKCE